MSCRSLDQAQATGLLGLFLYEACIMRRALVALVAVSLFSGLLGCASVNPAVQTLNTLLFPEQPLVDRVTQQGGLNPRFVYLHITPPRQDPLLAVLAYVDPHPQGAIWVWHAPGGQVLKTQNGRLAGLAGVPQAITLGSLSPSIAQWPADGEVFSGVRVWDAPLRYRYGIEETITLQPIGASEVPRFVKRHLERRLASPDTSNWSWVRQTGTVTGHAWFAKVAVNEQRSIVYSYQCLEDDFCLHLASWPLMQGKRP